MTSFSSPPPGHTHSSMADPMFDDPVYESGYTPPSVPMSAKHDTRYSSMRKSGILTRNKSSLKKKSESTDDLLAGVDDPLAGDDLLAGVDDPLAGDDLLAGDSGEYDQVTVTPTRSQSHDELAPPIPPKQKIVRYVLHTYLYKGGVARL